MGTDTTAVVRSGDGILLARGTNSSIVNNYVHHVYDQGLSVETGPWFNDADRYAKNMTIKGNLVEDCSGGMVLADWEALQLNKDSWTIFQNITIEDNYFMYSGYGWSHQQPEYDWGVAGQINNGNCNMFFGFPAKAGKDIFVKNNVFYLSKYALVGCKEGGQVQKQRYQVSFSGNTFVQNTLGLLTEWQSPEDYRYIKTYYFNLNAKKTVSSVLSDKTAIVLLPK
ncbi:MAG: right-handed parallel beta-helix repeat-containing protein [Bacillota bacterium]|nr:right-handed parallel beta-helix repeat-containing protein [Bacillota bacterium]